MPTELKQVIIVRDDLKSWQDQGMKKVVLKVPNLDTLLKYMRKAQDAGLVVSLITDAGRTHLEPGTTTCLGIGPDKAEKIDRVTGDLKLIS